MPGIKSRAVKEAKGTIEKYKDKPSLQDLLPLADNIKITMPEELTEPTIQTTFIRTANQLINWNLLNEIDLPILTQAFILLQQLKSINELMITKDALSDDYDTLSRRYLRIQKAAMDILLRFGITPVQRMKLTIDSLTVKKEESILDKIKKRNQNN